MQINKKINRTQKKHNTTTLDSHISAGQPYTIGTLTNKKTLTINRSL